MCTYARTLVLGCIPVSLYFASIYPSILLEDLIATGHDALLLFIFLMYTHRYLVGKNVGSRKHQKTQN